MTLRRIVSHTAGLTVQREVLVPARMDRSTFAQPLPASLAAAAARGHEQSGAVVPGGWHVLPEHAAAGLETTATDLARWAIAIADAHAGRSTDPADPRARHSARSAIIG